VELYPQVLVTTVVSALLFMGLLIKPLVFLMQQEVIITQVYPKLQVHLSLEVTIMLVLLFQQAMMSEVTSKSMPMSLLLPLSYVFLQLVFLSYPTPGQFTLISVQYIGKSNLQESSLL
jgi:hypothetical protein